MPEVADQMMTDAIYKYFDPMAEISNWSQSMAMKSA